MKLAEIFKSQKARPYIIAELSGNHNGSLKNALTLIENAAEAGADAVKLQTYTADTITIDADRPDFLIKHGTWKGHKLYDLYKDASTPWEWHDELFAHAEKYGLECFSSPFDFTAVDFLSKFDPPAYKVASFEVMDTPLLEKIAEQNAPVIISTGMAKISDLENALKIFKKMKIDVILLHCVSEYPATLSQMNLNSIPYLRGLFGTEVGLSDHSIGSTASIVATSLGASVIEKHICLDRSLGGVDSSFSLEPKEFASLVQDCRSAFETLGEERSILTRQLGANQQFTRSIYAVEDIKAGEKLCASNVRSIRPGYGLPPDKMNEVLGAVATRDISRGEPISFKMIT